MEYRQSELAEKPWKMKLLLIILKKNYQASGKLIKAISAIHKSS